jgi:DGQHR domain-containing protein
MIEHVRPTARIPGVQGQFGPRLVTYTTQLPAGALETVLGHDPRSKGWKHLSDDIAYIYNHLQRATTKPRLEAVMRYIRFRFTGDAIIVGAFPAISIAVQNPTEFQPLEGESGIGILHFDLSRRNLRVVVDGLGRASAALELVEMSESKEISDEARDKLKKLLSEFSLPTVFYMPAPGQASLSLDEMQQLFHDFNFKTTPVPPRLAIALDHSDLYIGLTNRLGECSVIKRFGGMEFKSASLGKKSTAIIVQQNMLKFVRGATEGEAALEASANTEISNPHLTEESLPKYQEKLETFLENFAAAMGDEAFKNRERLHLSAPGWAALGGLFHDLAVRLQVPDLAASAAALGGLDWSRESSLWLELVRVRNDGTTTLAGGGGATSRRLIMKVARQQLGLDKLLIERGLESAPDALPLAA